MNLPIYYDGFYYINQNINKNITKHVTINTSVPSLNPNDIDIEFDNVIKQLDFIAWIKTLDDMIELEKIEFEALTNYQGNEFETHCP